MSEIQLMSLSINIMPGETYYVVDYYGEMGFNAIFRGAVEDENSHAIDSELLLFEKKDGRTTDQYRYAACRPETSISVDSETKQVRVNLILRSSYYGSTVRGLKSVHGRPKEPKWMMIK